MGALWSGLLKYPEFTYFAGKRFKFSASVSNIIVTPATLVRHSKAMSVLKFEERGYYKGWRKSQSDRRGIRVHSLKSYQCFQPLIPKKLTEEL